MPALPAHAHQPLVPLQTVQRVLGVLAPLPMDGGGVAAGAVDAAILGVVEGIGLVEDPDLNTHDLCTSLFISRNHWKLLTDGLLSLHSQAII